MPTATKRRPAAKSKGRGRSRARKRPARQPMFEGTREALSEQLSAHSSDAAAIAAAVAGVLVALGVYTTAAGPLGDAWNVGLGAALGRGRFFVPIACFATTAALLIRRGDEPGERHGLRVGLGATLVVVSVTGLWHLAAGQPTSQNGLKAIEHAGGVLGEAHRELGRGARRGGRRGRSSSSCSPRRAAPRHRAHVPRHRPRGRHWCALGRCRDPRVVRSLARRRGARRRRARSRGRGSRRVR